MYGIQHKRRSLFALATTIGGSELVERGWMKNLFQMGLRPEFGAGRAEGLRARVGLDESWKSDSKT
jgi:hypothetical protein